ncbi:hypothetical protein [Paraflavitalea speifideaquila]|nr:hypothetical protein [Paraflavitalea speifideiaquila]
MIKTALFDLSKDPQEQYDLAAQYPEIVKRWKPLCCRNTKRRK